MVRVAVGTDDGEYYIETQEEAWRYARECDSPWTYEAFLERCVDITDEEDVGWQRLLAVYKQAREDFVNYVRNMGTDPRRGRPESFQMPVLREADPELERILKEEEEIERRVLPCTLKLDGFSCINVGDHETHQDRFGAQWTYTDSGGVKVL